jgi:hypothetical protein
MNSICRLLPYLLLIVAAAGTGVFRGIAWGQDDWEGEQEVRAPAAGAVNMGLQIPEETFDQWIFGASRNASQGRKRIESLLTLQVESVERACELSDAQKGKLRLAGRGDMKRFYAGVEEARKRFREARQDPNKFNQIWQEIQPLQTKLNSGFFDDASLFYKVLKRTLDAAQTAEYEQREYERRKFRYETKIGLAIVMVENGMPLRDEQRQKFMKLLVEETEPPKKFGQSQYDYYVVMLKAAKLPESKVKPIFDDAQWRALSQQFAQAKGMEQTLRRSGIIP